MTGDFEPPFETLHHAPGEEIPEEYQQVAEVVFVVADSRVEAMSLQLFDEEWLARQDLPPEEWVLRATLAGCVPHLRNPGLSADELRERFGPVSEGVRMRVACQALKMGSCSKRLWTLTAPGDTLDPADDQRVEAVIAAHVLELLDKD